MNNCCIAELRQKEVISSKTGCRLGCVNDVEVNVCDGKITAIIIWGRGRCFNLFGRQDDLRIPWCDIEVIGEDTILVRHECDCNQSPCEKKPHFFDNLFR